MYIIGVGSVYFHSTLSLMGQLLDEIAIIWACLAVLATWFPTKSIPSFLQGGRSVSFATMDYCDSVIL